jgi:hypothetical protein
MAPAWLKKKMLAQPASPVHLDTQHSQQRKFAKPSLIEVGETNDKGVNDGWECRK